MRFLECDIDFETCPSRVNRQLPHALRMNFSFVTRRVERHIRDHVGIPPTNERTCNVENGRDPSTFVTDLLCSVFSSFLLFCTSESQPPGEGLRLKVVECETTRE